MLSEDKIHYKRNMLIAVIIGELIIIFAFIFAPEKSPADKIILQNDKFIPWQDVPITIQNSPVQPPPPKAPKIPIAAELSPFEILEDVSIAQNMNGAEGDIASNVNGESDNIKSERSAPRLIYEVVPSDKDKELNGRLQLSLKINENGEVVDHRIISNSLDCDKCLNDIIQSAYKSKWQPAIVNGKKEDYWVVKSYSFN